jgi:hypothetical protein
LSQGSNSQGLALSYLIGALARLGVARSCALEGDTAKAGAEPIMLKRTSIGLVMAAIVVSAATWAMLGTAVSQKATVPKPQEKVSLGDDEVKQLLLLIDTDKNGKIFRQEWIKFMEVEFDRLDTAKNGQLDIKELAQSRFRASHFASVGK